MRCGECVAHETARPARVASGFWRSAGARAVLRAVEVARRFTLYEALEELPELFPFAKGAGGNLWCWTIREPESDNSPITHVENWGEPTEYSPTFETFLYRTALEDASGRWITDDLPRKLRSIASILSQLNALPLADDLAEAASRKVLDAPGRNESRGVLTIQDCRERIREHLGVKYLKQNENWF